MALSKENIARITDLLRDNPTGLSITDIVKKTGINRNTAGRYLERLLISGQVEMRHFGMAKIYTASQRVPVSAMLSISSDLVMQLDSGMRIVFVNEPFLILLRVTTADLLGKNIEYSAAFPVFENAIADFLTRLKSGISGKNWHGTLELEKGERFYSCHITPLVFNDGRKGVSIRLEDLTDLRHREIALEKSESQLRKISEGLGGQTPEEIIHELQVHQIELETQAEELLRIQHELENSRNKYIDLYESAPVGYLTLTKKGFITEANFTSASLLGVERTTLINRGFARFVTLESLKVWEQFFAAVRRQEKKQSCTLLLERGDSSLFSARLEGGQLSADTAILIAFSDITEIRKAEEALRESEERFRKLVEISPDAVILHRNGIIIYVNPAAQKLVGALVPEEMVGKPVLDFIDTGFRDVVTANIQKDLGGKLSPQIELPMLRLDGSSVFVEGRGVKTFIEGKPAVMVTLRDITGRKLAEEKLFNSRQMLQLVLDTIPVRVFWKDRDLVFLGANKALALDAGYADPGDLVGKTDYDTAFAATADKYQADDREVMETGTPKLNFEECQVRRDGSTAWLRTSKVPLRNKSGDVIGILGTYEDITEHKMLENELNATAERYKQLAECSLDALVITDLRGEVITTNKAALALVELEDNTEVQGTSVFRFLAPESRERAQRDFAAMSPSRKAVMQTYTGITARGNRITVEAMGNPITYKGSPANIISIREISKRTFSEDNPGTNE